MPRLLSIHLAPAAGAPMLTVPSALLLPAGLQADRYALHTGAFSRFPDPDGRPLSLFSLEHLTALQHEGYDLSHGRHRRNLLTQDLDFSTLFHKTLRIGPTALIRITRPCSTCQRLERLTHLPNLARALQSRAGLRATVLTPGPLHAGDPIELL